MHTPEERPNSKVRLLTNEKPKLIIFDDKAWMLAAFTKKFEAMGYDVVPIYVADSEYEWAVKDGLIKRSAAEPSKDRREQDYPAQSERTIDTELPVARAHAEAGKKIHASYVRNYEAMQDFHYGVASKQDVENVLNDLKKKGFTPDCILSDLEMRHPRDVTPGTEFMGDDAMALAEKMYPHAPRAIHTTLYSFPDKEDFQKFLQDPENGEYNTEMYTQALMKADKGGYLLSGKDVTPEQTACSSAIDRYFKHTLAMGRPPRIVMGAEALGR